MLKGLRDEDGHFYIQRGTELVEQLCRNDGTGKNACGDFCPAFREPVDHKNGKIIVKICDGITWVFDEFIDNRFKEENNGG